MFAGGSYHGPLLLYPLEECGQHTLVETMTAIHAGEPG
jgi:hypothetical protein